jgi:hypothetical protein
VNSQERDIERNKGREQYILELFSFTPKSEFKVKVRHYTVILQQRPMVRQLRKYVNFRGAKLKVVFIRYLQ